MVSGRHTTTAPVDLGPLRPPRRGPPPKTLHTKKTLLRSPLVASIHPSFRVSLCKPPAGLPSSANDENDQTLHTRDDDSFFEMSDDVAMWMGQAPGAPDTVSPDLQFKDDAPAAPANDAPKDATVELVVRASSVSVDGAVFPLNAAVVSAVVVAAEIEPEDSLLVSLSSGYLLLVRVWRVPRGFSDTSFGGAADSAPSTTSHYYKPFVVQWWQTHGPGAPPAGAVSGGSLSAHPAGLAVVSAAPDVFRIHMCETSNHGLQLSPHFNVPVDGAVLHSCFAHPLGAASSHVVFLAVVFTARRRLELCLYSWYVADALSGNLEKATLPLNSFFPLPVLVVPLARNNSFLLVCPDEFVIVTLHNIWSADYSFAKFAYDGAFPTAFCHPAASVRPTEGDEVLLASESGIIYSVVVEDNKTLTYKAIMRLADPVSVFQLESAAGGYDLSYASDSGGSKKLHIAKIEPFDEKDDKVPYTDARLKEDYRNWAPIVDAVVVDSRDSRARIAESTQELWALTGAGKRTKLTQLYSGYPSKRDSSTYSALRKGESLSLLQKNSRTFILCSMSFGTRLFEYTPDVEADEASDDNLVEIGDPGLETASPTLWCGPLGQSDQFVQISRESITFSDIEHTATLPVEQSILFAHMVKDKAFLVSEHGAGLHLEVLQLAPLPSFQVDDDYNLQSHFLSLAAQSVSSQICMMKCYEAGGIWLLMGTFDGKIMLLKYSDALELVFELDLNSYGYEEELGLVPHDAAISGTTLYLGCKTGHFVELDMENEAAPKAVRVLRLGAVPLNICFAQRDKNFMFAYGRNVWMFNFYVSKNPSRVALWEKSEKTVTSMVELPTDEPQHLRFAIVGEEGLVIRSIFCHETPLLKQLSIGEAAKKLVFLDTANVFVLLCKSKNPLMRLKFADRKTLKMMPTAEFDSKTDEQRTDPIFAANEFPLCALVWEIPRQGRVSKKIIVGTSADGKGALKILDVSKVTVTGSKVAVVKQVELYSVPRDQPVTSVQQIDSTVFFSCGNCVYSTLYSIDLRKLRPVVKHLTLPSAVVSMSVGDKNLLVTTEQDSLYSFKWEGGEERTPEDLSVSYKDPTPRSLVNACADGKTLYSADKLYSLLYSMDPGSGLSLSYKVAMIPRVYKTSLAGCWDPQENRQICAIGVNGEVVLLTVVDETSDEVAHLNKQLALTYGLSEDSAYDELLERLERPFADKVTGKGFQSTYKPFFDFHENRNKLVDYDVEEFALACASNSFI